jgi:hypothetical protein
VTPRFLDSVKRIWYKAGPAGSTLIEIQCSVSWSSVVGASRYELKAGTADGPGDVQYSGTATSIQGSYNSSTYCASTQVLRACNTTGCSAWTAPYTQRVVYMNQPPDPGDPGEPPRAEEPAAEQDAGASDEGAEQGGEA